MSQALEAQIQAALNEFIDPYLKRDLVSAAAVKQVAVKDGRAEIRLELGYAARGYHAELARAVRARAEAVPGIQSASVEVGTRIITHAVQKGVKPLRNIKNIVAVASGKGGVGKSTIAVNLALALAAEGASVGILDADIYGPSQPRMLGAREQPKSRDGKSMEPVIAHGIQSMSIGYLVDEETPMIWRGPMVTQALEQLLRDTNWQPMDYLVVDLPPGTGDTQLTLAQKIPVSGAVIVTTPQDIALLDARKALKMFEKVDVPVLGIIENMSIYVCSHCGHQEAIFGSGGGARMAEQYKVDLLGQLPLDPRIRAEADNGNPSVVTDPEGRIAQAYREIARRVGARLSLQAKDYSAKIPNIVIEQN
jgi:ATP-binding protein involved in chromosome partitioning